MEQSKKVEKDKVDREALKKSIEEKNKAVNEDKIVRK
jgi:hypothetical protein